MIAALNIRYTPRHKSVNNSITLSYIIRLPPSSTLFPYTTLFRSIPHEEGVVRCDRAIEIGERCLELRWARGQENQVGLLGVSHQRPPGQQRIDVGRERRRSASERGRGRRSSGEQELAT